MTIVADVIAAEIAALTRVTLAPEGELGYGRDLSCVTDLTADAAEVEPDDPIAVAQACTRRLITPRGSVPDAPDYGLDLRGYCNRGVTASDLSALSGQITSELRKDDRVADAAAVVSTTTAQDATLSVRVLITPADPATDDFAFTLSVTDSDVLLETI